MSEAIKDLASTSVGALLSMGYSVGIEDRACAGALIFSTQRGNEIMRIEVDGRFVRGNDFRSDDGMSVALFDCLSRARQSLGLHRVTGPHQQEIPS